MAQIGGVLRKADALLVHLKKDPLFTITIPSKIQAYMAVGKPLLMAVDGNAADLVIAAGCGVLAESENPEAIADAALKLYALSALRSRSYYQSHLSLKVGAACFGALFKKLVK